MGERGRGRARNLCAGLIVTSNCMASAVFIVALWDVQGHLGPLFYGGVPCRVNWDHQGFEGYVWGGFVYEEGLGRSRIPNHLSAVVARGTRGTRYGGWPG